MQLCCLVLSLYFETRLSATTDARSTGTPDSSKTSNSRALDRRARRASTRTHELDYAATLDMTHTSTRTERVLSGATLSGIYKKQKKHGQQQLGPLALDV